MSASIAHAAWMRDPAVLAVMAALEAAGPGRSRFVGGCVRDALIGRETSDVDIATQMPPDMVSRALESAGLRAEPTGVEHGTVTAVSMGRGVEVTTLRRDVSTDGRRATVAFTEDWAEDAGRRDFRLNALYAEPDGAVHDPTGHGLADAKARRIVFIGAPEQRIREDYLRILRFFRFNAAVGQGPLDAAGLAACAALKDGLAQLSPERVWAETKKLFAAADPRPAWAAMAEAGVWDALYPELINRLRAEALVARETDAFLAVEPLARLAAALPDADAARALAVRLKLSNAERDRLTAALSPKVRIVSYMSMREVRRALYALGVETFCDQVKRAWADDQKEKTIPQWRALLALAAGWERPSLPLSGAEVMAAGVPAGPLVGRILREVEDWWIDADFPDDKLSLVERLKTVAQALA